MAVSRIAREENIEIDVREHVDVLVKRKKLVLIPLFILGFSALAWVSVVPSIYEVSVIIAPPFMETDAGAQDLDTIGNIKARINSGAFDEKIIRSLNLPSRNLQFEITQLKESKLMKVSMREPYDRTELGKKILAELMNLLELNYAQFIESRRTRIGNQIKIGMNNISIKENEIKLEKEQLKILADKEQKYVEEIKESAANSEKLLANREALLARKDGRDDISALLFTTTIQQNLNYASQLQNALFETKTAKESTMNSIANAENSIKEIQIGIEGLKLSNEGLHNVDVIQDPHVSFEPTSPKKLKSVFLAGLIGLILGVLSAFIAEYWEPNRGEV